MVLPVGFMICGVIAVKNNGMSGKGGVLLRLKGVMLRKKKLRQQGHS